MLLNGNFLSESPLARLTLTMIYLLSLATAATRICESREVDLTVKTFFHRSVVLLSARGVVGNKRRRGSSSFQIDAVTIHLVYWGETSGSRRFANFTHVSVPRAKRDMLHRAAICLRQIATYRNTCVRNSGFWALRIAFFEVRGCGGSKAFFVCRRSPAPA